MSASKKHLTSLNIVTPDDGVYAQQVNYGQSALRSVADVVTRHFEDYADVVIEDIVNSGFITSWAGGASMDIQVSVGEAGVNGIWVTSNGVITVTIPTTADTYFVVLQTGDDAGTQETRNPLNDTITCTYVTDGAFDESTDYPLAKVVVAGGVITSHEDFGAYYLRRMDYIKPRNQANIKVFTGTHPDATTLNTFFSGITVRNKQDSGGFYTGFDNDLRAYHLSGTGNVIDNLNSNALEFHLNSTNKMRLYSSGLQLVNNLLISGTSTLEGAVLTGGTFTASGASVLESTLVVSGTTTLHGAVTINADITFNSDDFLLNDNARIGIDSDTNLLTLQDQVLLLSGSLELQDNKWIGIESDTNLLTLQSNLLRLSGAMVMQDGYNVGSETDPNLLTYMNGYLLLSGNARLQDNATIGIESDTDLMTLSANQVTVAGTMSGSTRVISPEVRVTTLTNTRLVQTDGSNDLNSVANLQSWIAGTTNQITVSDDGDGTVTLSTPQNLHTSATPTFGSITINGNVTINDNAYLGSDTIPSALQITGTQMVGSVTYSGTTLNVQTINTSGEVTISSQTANRLAYFDASKQVSFVSNLADWVAGTTNQVTVANDGDGSITLSTPQNIHTLATPTFAGLTVNGSITVTGTVDGVDVGALNTSYNSHIGSASAHHVKYAITDTFDADEVTQLQNINTATISNQQWFYLGALNQHLTTTSTVDFEQLDLNQISAGEGTISAYTTLANYQYAGHFEDGADSGFDDGNVMKIEISGHTSAQLSASDNFIRFFASDGEVGSIEDDVVYVNFTGSHNLQTDSEEFHKWEMGMVLISAGRPLTEEKSFSSAFVTVDIATKEKDPRVMGVLRAIRESKQDENKRKRKAFNKEKKRLGKNAKDIEFIEEKGIVGHDWTKEVISVNALGEGHILVCDVNGEPNNGDYVTSSNIYGHAQLQEDDLLHNYTVAKITEEINWDEVLVNPEYGVKTYLATCTYHCG